MPPRDDCNFPVAILAFVALVLLSLVALRMIWLGVYEAFGMG